MFTVDVKQQHNNNIFSKSLVSHNTDTATDIPEGQDNFLNKFHDICCDPSLEPSRRDGSHEGSQHMILLRN